MSEESKNVVARTSRNELRTMPLAEAIDAYTPQFVEALPDHIPLQKFKRTVLTALNQNPDLAAADRQSLFLACVKCAHDGLYPDGREAALVVFNTKNKDDVWIKLVQYLPMISGIRKLMRNTGEVLSATAEVVHKNDHFHYVKGENPHIEHEPPALDKERGEPVGAYAIIKLANGETLREVMGLHEIERVRTFSKTGKSASSPWATSWAEMARKTVLRRCAKNAPTGSDQDAERMHQAFARDDEEREDAHAPPRPTREQFRIIESEETKGRPAPGDPDPVLYAVNLADGIIVDGLNSDGAFKYMTQDMNERACAIGQKGLEAFWEDNKELMALLHADGYVEELGALTEEYNTISARLAQTESHPDRAQRHERGLISGVSSSDATSNGSDEIDARSATLASGEGQAGEQMAEGTGTPPKISAGASSQSGVVDLTKPAPTSFREAAGDGPVRYAITNEDGKSGEAGIGTISYNTENSADYPQDRPQAATPRPPKSALQLPGDVVSKQLESEVRPDNRTRPIPVDRKDVESTRQSEHNATPPANAEAGGKPRFLVEPVTIAGKGMDTGKTEAAILDMIKTLQKDEYAGFRKANSRILGHFNLYLKDGAARINEALAAKDKEFHG